MARPSQSPTGQPRRLGLGALRLAGLCWLASALPEAGAQFVDNEPKVRMQRAMEVCTLNHGYDPADADLLGPHQLGEGELAWRDCVYQAIGEILIPSVASPLPYERLILEDREMTRAIQAGQLTRAERKARLDSMKAGLEATGQLELGVSGSLDAQPQEGQAGMNPARARAIESLYRQSVLAPLGW